MAIMNQIRELIAHDHNAIERTPYSIALVSSQITKQDYLFSMAQMHAVHQALEIACDSCPQLQPYFTDAMRRSTTIERDLAHFESKLADFNVLPQTLAIVTQLTEWAVAAPLTLVGCIYILEGSRMGSLMLARPIAAALGVTPADGNGIDYHTEGARETPGRLKLWKEQVSAAGFTPEEESDIATGAGDFMKMLTRLYEVLPAGKTIGRQAA